MRTKQRNNLAETARHERVAQNTDVYAVKARNYKGLRRGSPVLCRMNCCTMWWNNETQEWNSWSIFAESAFRTKSFDFVCDADCVYDEIAEKAEKLITIILVNSDRTAADMRILYDSEENVIKDTDAIYHKQ